MSRDALPRLTIPVNFAKKQSRDGAPAALACHDIKHRLHEQARQRREQRTKPLRSGFVKPHALEHVAISTPRYALAESAHAG